MKKQYRVKNGKKGGRPPMNNFSTFIIPKLNTVILTENQYNKLLEKYGKSLLQKALEILDNWLLSQSGIKYKGKNNYAHLRSDGWVINEAKTIVN